MAVPSLSIRSPDGHGLLDFLGWHLGGRPGSQGVPASSGRKRRFPGGCALCPPSSSRGSLLSAPSGLSGCRTRGSGSDGEAAPLGSASWVTGRPLPLQVPPPPETGALGLGPLHRDVPPAWGLAGTAPGGMSGLTVGHRPFPPGGWRSRARGPSLPSEPLPLWAEVVPSQPRQVPLAHRWHLAGGAPAGVGPQPASRWPFVQTPGLLGPSGFRRLLGSVVGCCASAF